MRSAVWLKRSRQAGSFQSAARCRTTGHTFLTAVLSLCLPGYAGSFTYLERGWRADMLAALGTSLEQNAVDGFRWLIDIDREWPFFLAPVDARAAFMDLFSDYPFPSSHDVASWEDIRSHYDRLSQNIGFGIEPPNLVLTQVGHQLAESGDHDAALEVLHHLVEIYPHSLDGPWQLANLHRMMGDTATAISYYEECLRREPNMVPARTWLERLRAGRTPQY